MGTCKATKESEREVEQNERVGIKQGSDECGFLGYRIRPCVSDRPGERRNRPTEHPYTLRTDPAGVSF